MYRAILASVAACLFLLQTLTFVFSPANAWGGAGGSIVMAGDICRAAQDGGGKSPTSPDPSPCHHCILCTIGAHDSTLNAFTILANVFVLLSPRLNDAPAWPHRENRALWPSGSASAWPSGVPPPIS
jgi:hypothetical protein